MSLGSLARTAAPRTNPYAYQTAKNTTAYPQNVQPTVKYPTVNYGGSQPLYGGSFKMPSLATSAANPPSPTGDYTSQLANDATLQAALKAINDQGLSDTSQLTAARQTALIRYGGIPDNITWGGAGDVNADINQTTRDLASQATDAGVSTVAQLRKAYADQQAADNASLAARGMLHSGALGQHANADLAGYQQADYGARNSLLDYLGGQYQSYLQAQSGERAAAADATNQALTRIIAQIQAGLGGGGNGGGGAAAPPDAAPQGYTTDTATGFPTINAGSSNQDYTYDPINGTPVTIHRPGSGNQADDTPMLNAGARFPSITQAAPTGLSGYARRSRAHIH